MKHTQKIFAVWLCMILLLCATLPVSASDKAEDTEPEIRWELSEDGQTLTYGDQTYTHYVIPSYDWFRPYQSYQYVQEFGNYFIGQPILGAEGEEVTLYEDMVVLYVYFNTNTAFDVYVTAQGARALDEYMAGNYAQYELTSGTYESATISEQTVRAWSEADATETVDATLLGELISYNVIGYDSTLTFAHLIGQVFEYNGDYLFVNYSHLNNTHFDSYGNLSFRSGNVPVVRLSATDKAQITDAIDRFEYYDGEIVYEVSDPLDATISMVLFLLLASPFLYILPVLLLVFSIVMRNVKKFANRKRWNTVIIASIIWLGLSLLASCILVIPTFFL